MHIAIRFHTNFIRFYWTVMPYFTMVELLQQKLDRSAHENQQNVQLNAKFFRTITLIEWHVLNGVWHIGLCISIAVTIIVFIWRNCLSVAVHLETNAHIQSMHLTNIGWYTNCIIWQYVLTSPHTTNSAETFYQLNGERLLASSKIKYSTKYCYPVSNVLDIN